MASLASQLIEEVTAHAQSDSLEDARVICADGTYFLSTQFQISRNDIGYRGQVCRDRTALFWVITQQVAAIPYRRFGTTYRVPTSG